MAIVTSSFQLDGSYRRYDRVVIAGSPLRLFKLSAGGQRVRRSDRAGVAASHGPRQADGTLGRRRRASIPSPSASPFTAADVTVVVPAFNALPSNVAGTGDVIVVDDAQRAAFGSVARAPTDPPRDQQRSRRGAQRRSRRSDHAARRVRRHRRRPRCRLARRAAATLRRSAGRSGRSAGRVERWADRASAVRVGAVAAGSRPRAGTYRGRHSHQLCACGDAAGAGRCVAVDRRIRRDTTNRRGRRHGVAPDRRRAIDAATNRHRLCTTIHDPRCRRGLDSDSRTVAPRPRWIASIQALLHH